MRDAFFDKIKKFLGRDAIQAFYKLLSFVPDKPYLKFLYRVRTGLKLNLKNPKRFNEKLQWIKLYDRNPDYTIMVDKYLVKQYVTDKIGSEYVIPLLGVWERAADIDFDKLPKSFVLKCSHDSCGLVICPDKAHLDVTDAKKRLKRSLKNNYFLSYREWPYRNVKRRIIAEEYISDSDSEDGRDLPDYKVLCFNGKPVFIEVHKGRFLGSHTQDWFDTSWKPVNISQPGLERSSSPIQRPVFLGKMLELSAVLAEGIPEVRVDWYYANKHLFFGELTFFDGSGFVRFNPDEYDFKIGELLVLPSERRVCR